MKLLLVWVCFLTSLWGWAQEKSIFEANFLHSYTSDQVLLKTFDFSYRNHRRNHLWEYKDAEQSANDYGIRIKQFSGHGLGYDFKAVRATGLLAHKFSSSHYVEFEIGVHALKDHVSVVPWKLNYQNNHHLLHGTTSIQEDLMFPNLMFPGSMSSDLKGQTLQTRQVLTLHPNIRVPMGAKFLKLNDGNDAAETTVDFLWGKAYPIWFWLGLGVMDLRYQKQTDSYWSPDRFKGFGTRFEISYDVWNLLSFSWTLNCNRIQENNYAWGNSYLNALGVSYGDRNQWQVKASWTKIKSLQEENTWKEDDLSIQFIKSF